MKTNERKELSIILERLQLLDDYLRQQMYMDGEETLNACLTAEFNIGQMLYDPEEWRKEWERRMSQRMAKIKRRMMNKAGGRGAM